MAAIAGFAKVAKDAVEAEERLPHELRFEGSSFVVDEGLSVLSPPPSPPRPPTPARVEAKTFNAVQADAFVSLLRDFASVPAVSNGEETDEAVQAAPAGQAAENEGEGVADNDDDNGDEGDEGSAEGEATGEPTTEVEQNSGAPSVANVSYALSLESLAALLARLSLTTFGAEGLPREWLSIGKGGKDAFVSLLRALDPSGEGWVDWRAVATEVVKSVSVVQPLPSREFIGNYLFACRKKDSSLTGTVPLEVRSKPVDFSFLFCCSSLCF